MKILLLIPIIGTLILTVIPLETLQEKIRGKQIALITSILTFLASIVLFFSMDASTSEFQFLWQVDIMNTKVLLGVDGISIWYIVLSSLLIPICLLTSWDTIVILERVFLISMLSILILLILVFAVLDLLGFYILFEAILIPMFLIIGVWGAREQKITAAYYFFFYTLVGSILMLISILYIYHVTGTTDYLTLLQFKFSPYVQNLIFLAFFASFAVKIPKFPFHIWLPLAHVEAPLAGSILLAGILIKLGSYGFIRYSLPLLPDASVYFAPLVYTLSILGIIYASLTTIRQIDLKRIIAYSSVSHMGVVMLGIFSFNIIGIEGSIFLQIAHGVVSSALFAIVTVLYDRHHTRIIKYYRGVTVTMPIFSFLFLFFSLANIGIPLSCNFIGEFLSLLGIFVVSPFVTLLGSMGVILSACYALFLYNRIAFGAMSVYIQNSVENRDLTRREFYVLFPLAFLTIFLGVFPNFILDPLHASVLNLISYFPN